MTPPVVDNLAENVAAALDSLGNAHVDDHIHAPVVVYDIDGDVSAVLDCDDLSHDHVEHHDLAEEYQIDDAFACADLNLELEYDYLLQLQDLEFFVCVLQILFSPIKYISIHLVFCRAL